MKKFKVVCMVDKCTIHSKDEEDVLFITAKDEEDAEKQAKYYLIEKGWSFSRDMKITII